MYISILKLSSASENDLVHEDEAAQLSQRDAEGFRWAMLLRSTEDAASYTSVSMWLTPEHEQSWRQAGDAPRAGHGYDVTIARGSMTPATAVAIVDWRVQPAEADRFAARWNAAYHAIEDAIGSRLLRDLASPESLVALHVVAEPERLDQQILAATLRDAEGLAIAPAAVQRFDVVLLTEAP